MRLVELHEACCNYLLIERGETSATVSTYKANFREFCTWLEGQCLPLDVSSISDYKILTQFMYYLAHRKLHRNTIRQRMISLKTFCKYLLRDDFLQRNPFDRFDIPKKVRGKPRPVGDNVRDKLLSLTKRRAESSSNVRDIQAAVIMELGFKVGLRKGAMQNLLWEEIDFEEGYAYVVDKGQKEKYYPLAPSVVHWLKRLKLARGALSGPVILSPKSNTSISDTSLHDEFKRYVSLCGVDESKIGLHSMRHTYGTTLHEQGFDIRDIQVAMGHDDIASTQVYVDVPKKELRERIRRAFSKSK
ncbi:hypothetical protein NBG4_500026 [Candidatus Sulfobium mesophilum]|uniref:Uncharacterized protein n=1 Tax=Candidatus Sulfobium mesophilum TaxID=2016548 RepID=A0A2U3QIW3_9BACT|nr:hypothetical protein NBG4_500026 [Candidatus Sulfobium mesophilum]